MAGYRGQERRNGLSAEKCHAAISLLQGFAILNRSALLPQRDCSQALIEPRQKSYKSNEPAELALLRRLVSEAHHSLWPKQNKGSIFSFFLSLQRIFSTPAQPFSNQ
jgi:hypothetical protein